MHPLSLTAARSINNSVTEDNGAISDHQCLFNKELIMAGKLGYVPGPNFENRNRREGKDWNIGSCFSVRLLSASLDTVFYKVIFACLI